MTKPILDIRGLRTEFRVAGQWVPAVNSISFNVRPDETVAVVGESGSGKSVTALSVLGLLPALNARIARGEILFDGRDLTRLSEREMSAIRGNAIAMIFQEPMTSLNPTMTVGQQIAECLLIHRDVGAEEARCEVLQLFDRVRIPSAANRVNEYPHQFSGGMRQRAMIAMALACRPRLLIADEPTTALDVTIQAQILELIKQLQEEEGMGVLFITHDMGVVAEIADRAVVMRGGDVVETGACTDIFARPEHPYTRTLISAVPELGSMAQYETPMPFAEPGAEGSAAAAAAARPGRKPDYTGDPLLDVRNLTTRFEIRKGLLRRVHERVHAVENVSFDLYPGETLSLVGESGCGKSTIGRSLLRLAEPVSGSVMLEGRNILDMGQGELRRLRRRIQMIFQDPFASLDPRQRVRDALAEPLFFHGLTDRRRVDGRIAELLRNVGLDPAVTNRYPHEFSGGQRQRICIARALALEPSLIVADESVSALDVSIKAQIINLLLELQERLGLAYLFISHDMAVVERVSHRVAVMYLGEIVEIGPRQAVFGNPQHPYTQKLMSAILVANPTYRRERHALEVDEIGTAVRPAGYVPPVRTYQEVAMGHFVQNTAAPA